MTRRTFARVAALAVSAERAKVAAAFAEQIADVRALAARGRIDPPAADLLVIRLETIAERFAIGLHDIEGDGM